MSFDFPLKTLRTQKDYGRLVLLAEVSANYCGFVPTGLDDLSAEDAEDAEYCWLGDLALGSRFAILD